MVYWPLSMAKVVLTNTELSHSLLVVLVAHIRLNFIVKCSFKFLERFAFFVSLEIVFTVKCSFKF